MEKKSILMLMSVYQKTSGHTKVIDNLSKYLIKLGYTVTIGAITFQKEPPENVGRIDLTYTNAKSVFKNYDIIHNHQTKMNYYSLFTSKPFLFQYHGASTKLQKINLYLSLLLCKKNISKIITVSKSSIEQLPIFVKNDNIHTIYNGIDTEFYNSNLKLKNKNVGPQLLFTGNLFKYKNVQLLIQSMKKFIKKYPKAHLEIVGDGEYKIELEKLIRNNHLEENVSLLGQISDDKLKERYLISDVYVSASTFETFGMPLLEAMACGKPVAVSNIPAHNELVEESNAGLCFSLNEDDIIDKITFAYENKQKLGNNGRKFAEKLNWNNIAKEYGKLYENI